MIAKLVISSQVTASIDRECCVATRSARRGGSKRITPACMTVPAFGESEVVEHAARGMSVTS